MEEEKKANGLPKARGMTRGEVRAMVAAGYDPEKTTTEQFDWILDNVYSGISDDAPYLDCIALALETFQETFDFEPLLKNLGMSGDSPKPDTVTPA